MAVDSDVVADLAGSIARSSGPVTFLLGSGASLSSGAPTTSQVAGAFAAVQTGRFGGLDLRSVLHMLPEQDKQNILGPLFAGVSPGVGYHALGALSRSHDVRVLNLNWDDAVTKLAATGATVDSWDLLDFLPPGGLPARSDGIYQLHLHGQIGVACRFGTLETLDMTPEQTDFIFDNFLRHTTVILGASLIGETDLPRVFARHRRESIDRPVSALWYFGRESAPSRTSRAASAQRRTLTGSSFTHFEDVVNFDFDDFVVDLTNQVLGGSP